MIADEFCSVGVKLVVSIALAERAPEHHILLDGMQAVDVLVQAAKAKGQEMLFRPEP